MSIEDDLRQAVGERQGAAIKFTDIDGVGQKTAQKIRRSGRITGPSDVSDMTADELADQAGISENRARKAIEGGGGNPDRKPRSNTGSVSAAGIKTATGEFMTDFADKDKAEARFSSSLNRGIGRSQNAAIADKSKRAPVTTDFERWKDNKGELDFPGVDTPSESPQFKQKDRKTVDADDTTLEQRQGAIFPQTGVTGLGDPVKVKADLPGGGGLGTAARDRAKEAFTEETGSVLDEFADERGPEALAEVTFLERDRENSFGSDKFVSDIDTDTDLMSFNFTR